MIHRMLVGNEAELSQILSGAKHRQVLLKNLSKEKILPGDKVIFHFPHLDTPVGVAEILEINESLFQDVTGSYWLEAGFLSIQNALGHYLNLNANLQMTDSVVMISWGPVTKSESSGTFKKAVVTKDCEECCERDQT